MTGLKANVVVVLLATLVLAGILGYALVANRSVPDGVTGTPLMPTEFKYRLLDRFGDIFYCDPDEYPVARRDEAAAAEEWFGIADQTSEEFRVILARVGSSIKQSFTPEEKFMIYREYKKLQAIFLDRSGDGYMFHLHTNGDKITGKKYEGTIDMGGTIRITKEEAAANLCPICTTATQ